MGKIFQALEKFHDRGHARGKRKHRRTACSIEVDCDSEDFSYRHRILNISCGGAFLDCKAPLGIGQKIVLLLVLPKHPQGLAVQCTVLRRNRKGVAVKFDGLSQYEQEAVACFVDAAIRNPDLLSGHTVCGLPEVV